MPEVLKEILGALNHEERGCLYDLAKEVPEGKAIVEIGAWRGLSACCLGLGSLHGNGVAVYSIDPHEQMNVNLGTPFGDYGPSDIPKFYAALQKAGVEEIVRPVMLPDYGVRWTSPRIGLLFIDASHQYEDTLRQWKEFEPFVDGPIVFDDRDSPGVKKAIGELGWDRLDAGKKITVCTRPE